MRWITAVLAACLCAHLCQAATIHVPSEQPTIQAGIDAAIDGDTVLVAPGTYSGEGNRDIDFGGRKIVVMSEAGREETIIDCEGTYEDRHRGFIFQNGESQDAVVDGFTIINGNADFRGGGILCQSASPTIRNNRITDCTAYHVYENQVLGKGGGICCIESDARTIGNLLQDNYAPDVGGLFCSSGSPRVIGNIISSNHGWGVVLQTLSDSSLFSRNSVTDNVRAGIGVEEGEPTISHNFIAWNQCWSGIACYWTFAVIEHNTIVGNVGHPPSSYAGGITVIDGDPTVRANLIAFNYGGSVRCRYISDPIIECNNFFGNTWFDWDDCVAELEGVDGNFSADPLFCDTATGDFHLDAESPCLPVNNECYELVGAFDVGCGEVCGDADTSYRVDIDDIVYLIYFLFAGGSAPDPLELADSDCSGIVDLDDALHLLSYIFSGGYAPCDTDGDEVPDC